ncbi:MAG: vanillate O-demethylase oxidoreductase VanB, partial [Pseudomonadota bacterium]
TLVIFTLKDAPGNAILLTVVESGFDKVPLHRRREAFEMHTGGWEEQLQNIARHASS